MFDVFFVFALNIEIMAEGLSSIRALLMFKAEDLS